MIRIEETETFGWRAALRGMRNPKDSWYRADSVYDLDGNICFIGDKDKKLALTLSKAGTEHRKFLRFVHVQMDVTAPLFWWKEMETYKVGTSSNSCSTMHKLGSRHLTKEDFSIDGTVIDISSKVMDAELSMFNELIDAYNREEDADVNKLVWRTIVSLLPSSYNQKRTIDLNYEVLVNIHRQRKNHKLSEWHEFCEWIEELPYMKEILEVVE